MPRLFVAIELPSDVKERIVALQTDIPTARWVALEHMHLTLRFIGDVPAQQVGAVKSALSQIDSPPFDLALEGVGRFPPNKRKPPRVLWVGIKPQPILTDLQRDIENALVHIGLRPEEKPFHPHITLARFKAYKPVSQADDFLAAQGDLAIAPFTVTRFVLVNSVLSPQGPAYNTEAAFMLSGA